MEEYAVEVVVVVLPGVGEYHVKVLARLVDHRSEADDLRARPHDDQQLDPAVVLEMDSGIVGS